MLRKIFIAIFFVFATSCFAEELTGFLGIPFGTEKVESWKQMRAMGWNCFSETDDGIKSSLAFTDRQYAGKNVSFLILHYISNSFCNVDIMFDDDEDILPVINAMIKKYKLLPYYSSSDIFITKNKKYLVEFDKISNTISIMKNNTSSIESDI